MRVRHINLSALLLAMALAPAAYANGDTDTSSQDLVLPGSATAEPAPMADESMTAEPMAEAEMTASGDSVSLPPMVPSTAEGYVDMPRTGMTMAQVEAQYGAPVEKMGTVDDGVPAHPPITRWRYEDYIVYFEHQHVVNSVRTK